MKAVIFDEFGPPEVLRLAELPEPVPGDGEVVVRVAASTINPTDLMMRDGRQSGMMKHLDPPYIAGMEFSGWVHATGRGVDLPSGAPLIGIVNPRRPRGGAHAQYVAVPAASVALVSAEVPLHDAATVPMNAVTARLALDIAALRAGQTLLVTGGAGMLGGSVIQLARAMGLTVAATGDEADAPLLGLLGADMVLLRGAELPASLRLAFPDGVDAMIDGALIGQEISFAVKDGGTAVSLRKSHPIEDSRLNVDYVSVLNGMENEEIMRLIAGMLDSGGLRPRVASGGRFTCTDAWAAHRAAERPGRRGGILLAFGE